MNYKTYGKTGFNISELTFGAMRITFDENNVSTKERDKFEKNAIETMAYAKKLGINHIDTARGYANSERLVGMALKELGRENFYITTKISARLTREEANKTIDISLEKLDIDKIDIVDAHGINNNDILNNSTSSNGCVMGIQDAVADGRVAYTSCSAHTTPDVINNIVDTGLFATISLHLWLTHQLNLQAVEYAFKNNIGILILSPSEKSGLLHYPTGKLKKVCYPEEPVTLAHRWLLSKKSVTTLAIGASKPSDFDIHLESIKRSGPLTKSEQNAISNWNNEEIKILNKTRCSICYKCMPCPQDVAIPEILRLRNLSKTFDMTDFGKFRYNLLGNGGTWFPGEKADKCNNCGECLEKCPENLNIPTLLKETHDLLLGEEKKRLWK